MTNQLRLKAFAYHQQGGICPICNQPLRGQGELHHALITRGDVQGLPEEIRSLIHHKYNVVVVHSACHVHTKDTREKCYQFLCRTYTPKVIDIWVDNFPFVDE